jgi:hypothetical protein
MYIAVGFNSNNLKQIIMQKNIKFLLKLFFVIVLPLVTVIYYATHISLVYEKSAILVVLSIVPLLLVFFNAIFYSVHMSKIKLFSRWSATIFTGFGFIIALDDDNDVIIVIGCIGLTFRYKGLFSK